MLHTLLGHPRRTLAIAMPALNGGTSVTSATVANTRLGNMLCSLTFALDVGASGDVEGCLQAMTLGFLVPGKRDPCFCSKLVWRQYTRSVVRPPLPLHPCVSLVVLLTKTQSARMTCSDSARLQIIRSTAVDRDCNVHMALQLPDGSDSRSALPALSEDAA